MDTIACDKLINLSCLSYVLYMIYPLAKVSPWEQKKMKKETHTSTVSSYLFQRGERGNPHKWFDKSSFCPNVKYVN